MRIAVYTIAKDEEKFVSRWYDSAKEADHLLENKFPNPLKQGFHAGNCNNKHYIEDLYERHK